MQSNDKPPAKAQSDTDRSGAIVVSFDELWHEPIMNRSLSAIIRKRVPLTVPIEWVYFYVKAPTASICGRGKVKSCFWATVEQAHHLASALAMRRDEITRYLQSGVIRTPGIGCITFEQIETADSLLTAATLAKSFTFNPPQSFFFLSKEAKVTVDKLLGFSTS